MKPPTTQQLLKILAENKDAPASKPKNANDVHRFIEELDLKEGTRIVKNLLIYKAYKLWATKPLTTRAFFSRFSQYFKPGIHTNWRYYRLNKSGVQILNKVDDGKTKF